MLGLIFAVRAKSIELHAAVERALLPKVFAFNHVNYAGYLTVQHTNFEQMEIKNKNAWEDLVTNGFGGQARRHRFESGGAKSEVKQGIVRGGAVPPPPPLPPKQFRGKAPGKFCNFTHSRCL